MADQKKKSKHITASIGDLSLGSRSAMLVFMWIARIFALGIVVQVFLAGLALFVDSTDWAAHSSFPRYFAFLPILMILLSFITRLPDTYRVKSIQLFAMTILMFLSAILSSKIGFLSALHPVIALAMFWNTMAIALQAAAHTRSKPTGLVAEA
jgi:hypothetical protein